MMSFGGRGRAKLLLSSVLLGWLSSGCFRAIAPDRAADDVVRGFGESGVLEEAGSMTESASTVWWLNSGGRLVIEDDVASTLRGDLAPDDRWSRAYARSSALDTDGGRHPQNLFRLVTRRSWPAAEQVARFRIREIHLSDSPRRAASNGILFFHRYVDGNNLYYAGVRVDGSAVIKKKLAGKYTTLAEKKIFHGDYDRERQPNLLPLDVWFWMRSGVRPAPNGAHVYVELRHPAFGSEWLRVLEAVDDGIGGEPILGPGRAGIRADFMDVEFDDYVARPIEREQGTVPFSARLGLADRKGDSP